MVCLLLGGLLELAIRPDVQRQTKDLGNFRCHGPQLMALYKQWGYYTECLGKQLMAYTKETFTIMFVLLNVESSNPP